MINKIFRRVCTVVLLASLLVGCGDGSHDKLTDYGYVFQEVMTNEEGVFRGVNLGDDIDGLFDKEGAAAVENENDYLYYEYQIDSLTSFNVAYSFDQNGNLIEVLSKVYMVDEMAGIDSVHNDFLRFYTQHYGEPISEKGMNSWAVKSEKYDEILIALGFESTALGNNSNTHGIVSLWIYPNKR